MQMKSEEAPIFPVRNGILVLVPAHLGFRIGGLSLRWRAIHEADRPARLRDPNQLLTDPRNSYRSAI